MSKLQKKSSALKREHRALPNMTFSNFFYFFLGIFALLDTDPDSEYGSGSTDLIEKSGSNPDPDPKPWLLLPKTFPESNSQHCPIRYSMTAKCDLLYFRWCSALGPVLPTLCRTFRPFRKKNSAAKEKLRSPVILTFWRNLGLRKTLFLSLWVGKFLGLPQIYIEYEEWHCCSRMKLPQRPESNHKFSGQLNLERRSL